MYVTNQEQFVQNYINNKDDSMPNKHSNQATWPALRARGYACIKQFNVLEESPTTFLKSLEAFGITFVLRWANEENFIEVWVKEAQ